MANRSRTHSEKSASSSVAGQLTGNTDMEYFWCIELTAARRSVKWVVKVENEDDEDDDDFIEHTVFIRQAVLGASAVENERNIVVLESAGQDGTSQKGAIANLIQGVCPMTSLNFTISGKIGGTFTLAEGSGPVTISGNHLLEFPMEDPLDMTQAESGASDDSVSELQEEENEEEEEEEEPNKKKKETKNGKRKAVVKPTKQKQKLKLDDDHEDSEEESEEMEDDDSDEDYEEVKSKQAKKTKDIAKKIKSSAAAEKEPKKMIKKTKK